MSRCISCAVAALRIGCMFGLLPLNGHTAAPEEQAGAGIAYRLFRRNHPQAPYASYVLEVESSSEHGVRTLLDLRRGSTKLASIPLLPVTEKNAKGGQSTLWRVNCIALDEISDASFFYVFITDAKTGEAVEEKRMLFGSAELVRRLPGE